MTSTLIKQVRCPACTENGKDRSGDNLSIYSDGHEWCYSCGYYKGANGVTKFLSEREYNVETKQLVTLPYDCDVNYPYKALQWIEKYELTKNDLLATNTLWSENSQRLIFPIYGDDTLIAWQGRWFGDGKKVKWFGLGDLKSTFNILGRSVDTLILTEDIISAIKVSKFTNAMPLYGSHIGFDRWKRLLHIRGYKANIIIWLDKDKQSESVKFARQGRALGLNVSNIITELDPKELSFDKINETLNGCNN